MKAQRVYENEQTSTAIKLINTATREGHIGEFEASAQYIMSAAREIGEKWDMLDLEEQKVMRDTYYNFFLNKIHKLK